MLTLFLAARLPLQQQNRCAANRPIRAVLAANVENPRDQSRLLVHMTQRIELTCQLLHNVRVPGSEIG